MNRQPASVDFEARIDDEGCIRVPAELQDRASLRTGSLVHVRVTGIVLMKELQTRGVTERELRTIEGLQREHRSQVVRCILSEGAWKRGGAKRTGRDGGALRSRRGR